jgi:hypothetical protein
MAELFSTTQQNVALHLTNAFKEAEITKDSTHKESLYVAGDGKRRTVTLYNLDALISVGYRVKSRRGTEFRIWATRVLRDRLLRRGPHDAEIRLLRAELVEMRAELIGLRRLPLEAAISPATLARLKSEIKRIAILEVAAGDWPFKPRVVKKGERPRRQRSQLERAITGVRTALSVVIEWGSQGKPWPMFPAVRTQELFAVLRAREVDVMRKLGGVRAAKRVVAEYEGQLDIFEMIAQSDKRKAN